jgi:hypothetical protein
MQTAAPGTYSVSSLPAPFPPCLMHCLCLSMSLGSECRRLCFEDVRSSWSENLLPRLHRRDDESLPFARDRLLGLRGGDEDHDLLRQAHATHRPVDPPPFFLASRRQTEMDRLTPCGEILVTTMPPNRPRRWSSAPPSYAACRSVIDQRESHNSMTFETILTSSILSWCLREITTRNSRGGSDDIQQTEHFLDTNPSFHTRNF